MYEPITITRFFDETTLAQLQTLEAEVQAAKRALKTAQTILSVATDNRDINTQKALTAFVERAVRGRFGKGEVHLVKRPKQAVTFCRLLSLFPYVDKPHKAIIVPRQILQDVLHGDNPNRSREIITFSPVGKHAECEEMTGYEKGRYVEIRLDISIEEKTTLLQKAPLFLTKREVWQEIRKDFTDPQMFPAGTKIHFRFSHEPFYHSLIVGVVLPTFRVVLHKDGYIMGHGLSTIFADPEPMMSLTEDEGYFLRRKNI